MGLKDQFQDKARRLEEQAHKAAGQEREKSSRAGDTAPRSPRQQPLDDIRDQFDDR
ncbi:hypothetical protein LG634_24375 [Streptomyces bambusae]|uniref:hypothetical protein n=1 Tax=Streptomyces bambusae TaxID=1550616 RepID=UPI001CFC8483|nr:hypothetical protein [Streptomyces bambusae]MCB5167952.1 hypothetical protein [Streptomyces bambusae]